MHLVHFETSSDAGSWAEREKRFLKKFSSGKKFIKSLFEGLMLSDEIEQKAMFAFGSDANHKTVGGGQVVFAEDFLVEILRELKTVSFLKRAVPEKYPILRVLQMITGSKKALKELNRH